MTKQDIKQLIRVLNGQAYDAKCLRKALDFTSNLEYKICLKAEIANRGTLESRCVLDVFVCELQQGIAA